MRTSHPLARIALAAVALVSLVGCGINKAYPERHFWLLQAERPDSTAPVAEMPVGALAVRQFSISPAYTESGFVYRTGKHQYQTDFYNQWRRVPSVVITEAVKTWMRQSGMFDPIVEMSSALAPRQILEGNILSLVADFTGKKPATVLNMQLFLLQDRGYGFEVVFHKTYEQRVEVQGKKPEHLVVGWDKAVVNLLQQFEIDVRQALDLPMPEPKEDDKKTEEEPDSPTASETDAKS